MCTPAGPRWQHVIWLKLPLPASRGARRLHQQQQQQQQRQFEGLLPLKGPLVSGGSSGLPAFSQPLGMSPAPVSSLGQLPFQQQQQQQQHPLQQQQRSASLLAAVAGDADAVQEAQRAVLLRLRRQISAAAAKAALVPGQRGGKGAPPAQAGLQLQRSLAAVSLIQQLSGRLEALRQEAEPPPGPLLEVASDLLEREVGAAAAADVGAAAAAARRCCRRCQCSPAARACLALAPLQSSHWSARAAGGSAAHQLTIGLAPPFLNWSRASGSCLRSTAGGRSGRGR